jgi:hypothetical protein
LPRRQRDIQYDPGALSWQLRRDHLQHYRELATGEHAEEWFSIVPKDGQWDNTVDYDNTHPHGEPAGTAAEWSTVHRSASRQMSQALSIVSLPREQDL